MKFRLRSLPSKQTQRLEIADAATLADLKTLIASQLSPPIAPQSLRLSLNSSDELVADDPSASLPSLGLASGDIIYFSVVSPSDQPQTLTLAPPPIPSPSAQPVEPSPVSAPDSGPVPVEGSGSIGDEGVALEVEDEASVDFEMVLVGKASPLIPCFLKRVIESEKGEAESILGRLVIFVHAVLLESGFLVSGGGSKLPANWASKAASTGFSVDYFIPDLVAGSSDGKGERSVKVCFLTIGTHATVYGCLVGSRDVYRVSLNLAELAGLLSSDMNGLSEREAKDCFELWRMLKDRLSLPLLIDFCFASGVVLSSCFMNLPTELKIMIVGCLPGADVARLGCTCTEMRFLSSNDDVWKQKFLEEFGLIDERPLEGRSWKEKYAHYSCKRKSIEELAKRRRLFTHPNNVGPMFFPSSVPRFPFIGGDYDVFPDFNGFFPAQSRNRYPLGSPFLPVRRRNMSPNCDFTGRL